MLTITKKLDISPRSVPHSTPQVINVSQYDSDFEIQFKLYASTGTFTIEEGTTAAIKGTKPSGTGYSADASIDIETKTVTVSGDVQMTAVAGRCIYEIALYKDNKEINSANFILLVERAALDADTITDESVLRELGNFDEAIETAQTAATEATESAANAAASASAAAASAQSLVIDGTLSQEGQAADAKVTGEVRDNLKAYLLDKYETVEPSNWYNPGAITDGIMEVNGTITEDSDYLYTDYIPVEEGNIIGTFRNGTFAKIYSYRIVAFDADKNPISTKGRGNKTNSNFTIQGGVAYVRITFEKSNIPSSIKPIIVRDGVTPTTYTAYFIPYQKLTEDFLTEASSAIMQMLVGGSFSLRNVANRYGCAIHRRKFRKTIGIPMTWYYSSIITPLTAYISPGVGAQYSTKHNNKLVFKDPDSPVSSANGYTFSMYDNLLGSCLRSDKDYVSAGYGYAREWVAENLSDCTLLAIGDSTVDHDTMTSTILSHFAEQGHTVTLLGTLGDASDTNRNEGRAGWKATDYLTDKQYNGVVNPFYNPSTQTFDFSYYMTNQGYSGVDFVVLQLGINDLYNSGETNTLYSSIWNAIKTMIDSILAYNSGIKIILNLPTTPNSDQSEHSALLPFYQNRVTRYNDYAQEQAMAYSADNVRCSYCHMILDPDTEIRDNVHPTAEGYAKLGMEVVNQINCWQNGV